MSRLLAGAIPMIVAVGLLYLAVPRTIAAFFALPTEHLMDQIQDGEPPTPEQLEQLSAGRERALAWAETEPRYAELSLVSLMRAEDLFNREEDEASFALVERTVALSRSGLAKAPARPFTWTRLAYADFLRNEGSATAPKAFEMAVLTAPYEPLLTFPRLEIGLVIWDKLNPEQQKLVREQIAVAWRQSDVALVDLALLTEREDLVRELLPEPLENILRFDELRDAALADQAEQPQDSNPSAPTDSAPPSGS